MYVYATANEKNVLQKHLSLQMIITRLLTEITAAENEVALSYHRVRGLYF